MGRPYTLSDLVSAGLSVTRSVLRQILYFANEDPESTLEETQPGGRKRALVIDLIAESSFKKYLRTWRNGLFRDIAFYGEERLRDRDLNLSEANGLCVLVDAIDGTDLLERGLSNWCCASVFFKPTEEPGRRIQAAFVGLPNGRVYYATHESVVAFVETRSTKPHRAVAGPSGIKRLLDASLCFYGQKAENFRSFATTDLLNRVLPPRPPESDRQSRKALKDGTQTLGPRFRIYNLGGIPMMVSLVDRQVETASSIDAVVELKGQQPHDVVPGAFLALKGGAFMRKRDGSSFTIPDLEQMLLRPAAERIAYVLAATNELADDICAAIPWRSVGQLSAANP